VFVFGGARQSRAHVYRSYATGRPCCAGSKTFLELDPDIVTGYNIMGFDFQHLPPRSGAVQAARRRPRARPHPP
jgi:hypothetical protein